MLLHAVPSCAHPREDGTTPEAHPWQWTLGSMLCSWPLWGANADGLQDLLHKDNAFEHNIWSQSAEKQMVLSPTAKFQIVSSQRGIHVKHHLDSNMYVSLSHQLHTSLPRTNCTCFSPAPIALASLSYQLHTPPSRTNCTHFSPLQLHTSLSRTNCTRLSLAPIAHVPLSHQWPNWPNWPNWPK